MESVIKNNFKTLVIPFIFVVFSIACGIILNNFELGTIILISGLLNAWYASISKSYNYFFGAIFCLLNAYVTYINGLYGMCILSILVYFPLQIHGWISWSKRDNEKYEVEVRKFTYKNSIIITLLCILGSLLLGFVLTKIPGQQLAFLDSSSNAITLCGIILMNRRFRECWWIWLASNTIDISIWTINVINGSPNAAIMILVSMSYLIINVYGLIMWQKYSSKKQ